MGPPPARAHHGPHGALAAAPRPARTSARAGPRSRPPASRGSARPIALQPVALGLDLLAVVEEVGHVEAAARAAVSRQVQRAARAPDFMSDGAAAVHQVAVDPCDGKLSCQRHGVQMPGQDHPLVAAELGARHDGVADAARRSGAAAPRSDRLDAVGDRLLVAGDGLDVDQRAGQRDRVGETGRGSARPVMRRRSRPAVGSAPMTVVRSRGARVVGTVAP